MYDTSAGGKCKLMMMFYANKCLPGEFITDYGMCEKCTPGTFCPNGKTLSMCDKGTYSDNPGAVECKACQPGTFQADQVDPSACFATQENSRSKRPQRTANGALPGTLALPLPRESKSQPRHARESVAPVTFVP